MKKYASVLVFLLAGCTTPGVTPEQKPSPDTGKVVVDQPAPGQTGLPAPGSVPPDVNDAGCPKDYPHLYRTSLLIRNCCKTPKLPDGPEPTECVGQTLPFPAAATGKPTACAGEANVDCGNGTCGYPSGAEVFGWHPLSDGKGTLATTCCSMRAKKTVQGMYNGKPWKTFDKFECKPMNIWPWHKDSQI